VSATAIDSYQYYLEETKYQEKDTVHIISYRPLPNKNFDGLTGLLYINRKNFAIQSVTATPHDKPKMEITIRQLYSQIENEIWFPEQLHYEIVANVISGGKNQDSIKIIVKGQTFIKDVTINAPLQRKDFSVNHIFIAKNASVVDSIYWISQRQNTLSQKELNTYRIVDSIGN